MYWCTFSSWVSRASGSRPRKAIYLIFISNYCITTTDIQYSTQCSKMHSKHHWHNTLIISLEYHFKLTYYYFGIKSNLRLSCPSKNFRFQNFLVIIWHLSWHFVLFLNSKHCFSLNFDFLVTQPFISCEKSAESQLSVRYYLAGVSHYFFEANG